MLFLHLTFGITIGLMLILSGFLFFGKGTIMINGMMMMPKEARDKVNKKALGRFVCALLMVINITMALMWIDLAWLETSYFWLTWVATGIMLLSIIPFVIIGIAKRETWFKVQDETKKPVKSTETEKTEPKKAASKTK